MLGQYGTANQMNFEIDVSSSFPGNISYTQIIKSSWSASVLFPGDNDVGLGTHGSYFLDGGEGGWDRPLRLNDNGLYVNNCVAYDYPCMSLNAAYWDASRTDAMKTYFQFCPGGIDSIPVTLGIVSWGWNGSADNDVPWDVWTLITGSVSGPTFTSSYEFPFWYYTY
jgi:hypothetical protein